MPARRGSAKEWRVGEGPELGEMCLEIEAPHPDRKHPARTALHRRTDLF